MNSVVCSAFVLLAFVTLGESLVCYKCDSSESALCNYGIVSFTMPTVDCNDERGGAADSFLSWIPKECVKITAKNREGKEYVARGCVPRLGGACNVIARTLNFFTSVNDGVQDINCHTCEGDKCNSAPGTLTQGVTMLFLTVAVGAFLF